MSNGDIEVCLALLMIEFDFAFLLFQSLSARDFTQMLTKEFIVLDFHLLLRKIF